MFQVLDTDKNAELSLTELDAASEALTGLDKNDDGKLVGSEIVPRFGGGPGGPPADAANGFARFMNMIPLMGALDANGDGEISKKEVEKAPGALKALDKNRDERLDASEMVPDFGGFRGGTRRGGLRRGFGGGETATERQDPEEIAIEDGVARIPDREMFEKLSYQGTEVLIDRHLAGNEFVKFQIEQCDTDTPQVYFINTKTHRAHFSFMRAVGIPRSGRGGGPSQMRGVLVYRPLAKSPSGKPGLYTFEFEPNDRYPFEDIKFAYELLISKSELLKQDLGYYPMPRAVSLYHEEKAKYDAAAFRVYLDKDFLSDIAFLPLNPGETFGRLRLMDLDEIPSVRDVVLYKSLPNEMPRSAGIITSVRQTPLSHVNLRAIQDNVPNAYIVDAENNPAIKPLIGKFVAYKVSPQRFSIREATIEEVERHFEAIRPEESQVPERDLNVTEIKALKEIGFADFSSVGVKAANMAAMLSFGMDDNVVPRGFALPFSFYHDYMERNGFYDKAREIVDNDAKKSDRDQLERALKALRKQIEKGEMSDAQLTALAQVQRSFPRSTSIRCRSSTNNEDLPGFSGAGLYDSFTHKPDEGHLSKSVKQVFASLWNLRAFEEREFYRVDHFKTAMGVLMHPNFKDEKANGVAVTDDILYQTNGNHYINVQVGEDLVTNPKDQSVPEEILLDWYFPDQGEMQIMQRSNRVEAGETILNATQLQQLNKCLNRIHSRFAKLYGKERNSEDFAMEIEFKITKQGRLSIKQARPWVY